LATSRAVVKAEGAPPRWSLGAAAAPAAAGGAAAAPGAAPDSEQQICDLSESRRVTVSLFRGRPLVGIRQFYEKDGQQLPARQGISLTPEQWRGLLGARASVEAALAAVQPPAPAAPAGEAE